MYILKAISNVSDAVLLFSNAITICMYVICNNVCMIVSTSVRIISKQKSTLLDM